MMSEQDNTAAAVDKDDDLILMINDIDIEYLFHAWYDVVSHLISGLNMKERTTGEEKEKPCPLIDNNTYKQLTILSEQK